MDDLTGTALVARERERDPLVVDFARRLAIASRIEPDLMRAVRLAWAERTDASLEADLWFSPLVQGRDPVAMVLRRDARAVLLGELAADARRNEVDESWSVIERMHQKAPPVMRLEETATYLTLSGKLTEMERLLGGALDALSADSTDGIAHWVVRALPRLPDGARESSPALALARAASERLGGVAVEGVLDPGDTSSGWSVTQLRALTPLTLGVSLAVSRRADGTAEGLLTIAEPSPAPVGTTIAADAALLVVPRTRPLIVDVLTPTDTGWNERRCRLQAGERIRIIVSPGPTIKVRNLMGDEISLRAQADHRPLLSYDDSEPPTHLGAVVVDEARDLGWEIEMSSAGANTNDVGLAALEEGQRLIAVLQANAGSPDVQRRTAMRAHLIGRDHERFEGWLTRATEAREPAAQAPDVPGEPFFDREDVFAAIEDVLLSKPREGVNSRILVVTGEAGVGKSVVLREFARTHGHAARTIAYEAFDESPNDDRLGAMLSTARLAPDPRPMVIVVDGLDGTDKDEDPIARLWATLPLDGVDVITSARTMPETVDRPARAISIHELALSQKRWRESHERLVQDFWNGVPLPMIGSLRLRLERICHGNLRVAGMLRRWIDARPHDRPTMSALEGIEPGLRGIVELVRRDVTALQGPDNGYAHRILGRLTVARGAIPFHEAKLDAVGSPTQAGHNPSAVLSVLSPLVETRWSGDDRDWTSRILALDDRSSLAPLLADAFPEVPDAKAHGELLDELTDVAGASDGAGASIVASAAQDYIARYTLRHLVGGGRKTEADKYASNAANLAALFEALGYERGRKELAWLDAIEGEWSAPVNDCRRIIEQQAHWIRRDPGALPGLLWNQLTLEGRDLSEDRIADSYGLRTIDLPLKLAKPLGRLPTNTYDLPVFGGHTAPVNACASAARAPRAVSGSRDGTLRAWDLATGAELAVLDHRAAFTTCALTSDGAVVIAGTADGWVNRWHLEDELDYDRPRADASFRFAPPETHDGAVTACALGEAQRVFITGGQDGRVRVWPLTELDPVGRAVLYQGTHPVVACAVTEEMGDVVSVHADGHVQYTNLSTRRPALQYAFPRPVVLCAIALREASALAYHTDRTVTRLDLRSGAVTEVDIEDAREGWTALAVAGPFTARAFRRRAVFAREDPRADDSSHVTFWNHREPVRALAFAPKPGNPDQLVLLSASDDNTVKVWDCQTGRELHALGTWGASSQLLATIPRPVSTAAVFSGGVTETDQVWPLVYPTGWNSLAAYDLFADKPFAEAEFPNRPTACVFAPQGRDQQLLVGLADGSVLRSDDDRLRRFSAYPQRHDGPVTALVWHPAVSLAITASADGRLRRWPLSGEDTGDNLLQRDDDPRPASVRSLAVHPDEPWLVSAGDAGDVVLWNLTTGREERRLGVADVADRVCAMAPDGESVVTGSASGAVEQWQIRTNSGAMVDGADGGVNACVFVGGVDDLRLVIGSDTGALTDVSFGADREKVVLSGHTRAVTGCVAIPEASHVVSWSLDRALKLWDLDESTCVGTIYSHAPFVAVVVLDMDTGHRRSPSATDAPPARSVCRLAALDASGMVWLIDARIPRLPEPGSTAATG